MSQFLTVTLLALKNKTVMLKICSKIIIVLYYLKQIPCTLRYFIVVCGSAHIDTKLYS
jgi:hypothetical protein